MQHRLLSRFLLGLFLIGSFLGLSACSNGDNNVSIPGVDGPHVSLQQESMVIRLGLENIELEGEIRYSIPRYPSSWLEVKPAQNGGVNMTISLALADVLDGDLLLLDPQTLPGGRALPGVATGSLPAVAFSIEQFNNISFYAGPELFGLFVPADIGLSNSIATFRYYISDKRAGNLSLVGADDAGENAGLLLMLDLNQSNKRALKRYMNRF